MLPAKDGSEFKGDILLKNSLSFTPERPSMNLADAVFLNGVPVLRRCVTFVFQKIVLGELTMVYFHDFIS
jgi:hypothetical protein